MALNLDTTFKLKAKVEGARSVQDFKKQLTGLDKSSKMSKAQLGKMNIEINRMARAAGNTTKGLRNHIKALTLLRERTEYNIEDTDNEFIYLNIDILKKIVLLFFLKSF